MAAPGTFFLTETGEVSIRRLQAKPRPPPQRKTVVASKSMPSMQARSATAAKRASSPPRKPQPPGTSADRTKTGTTATPRQRRRGGLRRFANTVTAVMSMRQFSRKFGKKDPKPPCKLQNTYKLDEDESDNKFMPDKVEKAMHDILNAHLKGMTYDPVRIKDMVPKLSNLIKARVKGLKFNRHRIVCNLTIGQNSGQSVEFSSRCLWDESRDSWACASFTNDSIFAMATVHGVYFE